MALADHLNSERMFPSYVGTKGTGFWAATTALFCSNWAGKRRARVGVVGRSARRVKSAPVGVVAAAAAATRSGPKWWRDTSSPFRILKAERAEEDKRQKEYYS